MEDYINIEELIQEEKDATVEIQKRDDFEWRTFSRNSYREIHPDSVDSAGTLLTSTNWLAHVLAVLAYNDIEQARRSRVICFLKIFANSQNVELAKTDNRARGAIEVLYFKMTQIDGTKVEFTDDDILCTVLIHDDRKSEKAD